MGSPILVEGRLKLDEWEKDVQKRSKLGVVAERVQFLEGGGSNSRGEYGDAPSDEPAPARGGGRSSAPAHDDPPAHTEPEDDLPF